MTADRPADLREGDQVSCDPEAGPTPGSADLTGDDRGEREVSGLQTLPPDHPGSGPHSG